MAAAILLFSALVHADENFKDEELSGSDKVNVETIVRIENRIHQGLSNTPITRSLLEGYSWRTQFRCVRKSMRVTEKC
jgi:hypothetical protein